VGLQGLIALKITILFKDFPRKGNKGFQSMCTPQGQCLVSLYHYAMSYFIGIVAFVLWWLLYVATPFQKMYFSKRWTNDSRLEFWFTLIPFTIITSVLVPGLNVLFKLDSYKRPLLSFIAVGHQWYWHYEIGDEGRPATILEKEYKGKEEFECYLKAINELLVGELAQLTTDTQLVLPLGVRTQIRVTAADVIHCWTINSFGIKMDCVPGHSNGTTFFIKRHGEFHGMCSEICGVLHGFMPIQGVACSIAAWVGLPK